MKLKEYFEKKISEYLMSKKNCKKTNGYYGV